MVICESMPKNYGWLLIIVISRLANMRRIKKCQISQKLITVDDKNVNFEGFKRVVKVIIRVKTNFD